MPQRPTYEDLEERIRELEKALDERDERSGSSPIEATEPKRAGTAFKEKKRFPDKLVDAIPIPVFYKDRGGRYIGFNKAFETFFGEARGQLIGKTVFDISPPELAAIYHAKDNALFDRGGVQRYESQLKNAHGLLRDVIFQKSVYTDEKGHIIGLIGAILDITSRKRMIKAVQESEERSKALADASFEAIFLSDKGICIDQNQTAERMFGYTHCEAVGRHGTEWIAPEDRELVNHNMNIGRRAPYEVKALRKDGSTFPCEIQSRMMSFHGRAVWVTALRDISARKQAEEKLSKLNETLVERTNLAEQRAVQIQRLALELTDAEERERKNIASVLHDDFQQQLAYIKMMLGMLRKNADKMIVPQTDLLEKCIAECIEKSRNLSYSINPPVLNRKGLLAALEDLPREMENKHGLKVELRTRRGTEPESPALASILYRAARELLLNVVKHSGVNSATLDVHLDNEMIFIRLQDAGNGFHYDAVRSRQGRGSGFGLYNIEDRVTFMGGSMKIQTAPNKGCAVELTVPKCFSPKTARPLVQARDVPLGQAVKAEPSSSDPIRVSGQEDKIRILIADDHHLIRQALAKMLQVGNKMKVVGQAVDGGEAVRLATQLQPDVVLMDVNMPELNGFEATSRIKREFPHIGIIGLSMHNNGSARQKMLNAGAAAYLTKTESPETLIETILQVHQSSG